MAFFSVKNVGALKRDFFSIASIVYFALIAFPLTGAAAVGYNAPFIVINLFFTPFLFIVAMYIKSGYDEYNMSQLWWCIYIDMAMVIWCGENLFFDTEVWYHTLKQVWFVVMFVVLCLVYYCKWDELGMERSQEVVSETDRYLREQYGSNRQELEALKAIGDARDRQVVKDGGSHANPFVFVYGLLKLGFKTLVIAMVLMRALPLMNSICSSATGNGMPFCDSLRMVAGEVKSLPFVGDSFGGGGTPLDQMQGSFDAVHRILRP